jgi:hypothetical protein
MTRYRIVLLSALLLLGGSAYGDTIYSYTAPPLAGGLAPATNLTLTVPGFITTNETFFAGNPALDVITPTSGITVTEVQITSPTTTAASFNVFYSDGVEVLSNFGENFDQVGSFPNMSGARLTISQTTVPEPSALMLMATGVLGLAGILRRRLRV